MTRERSPETAVRPLRPEEITEVKERTMPDEVIQTFNTLIVESFINGRACIKQDDIMERLADAGLSRSEIFDKGWLDVEDIYRRAGWEVLYDKPGYNETYRASFIFSVP